MENADPLVATVRRLASLGARLERDHAPRRLRMRVLDVMTRLEGQLPIPDFDAARLEGEAAPFVGDVNEKLASLGVITNGEDPSRAAPEGPPACLRSVARRIP